jgi:hypothetical protein
MSDKNVWDILNRNLFFVKNAVAKREAKTSDKLDVYDPESHQIILECREPNIGALTKIARLIGGRHDEGTSFNFVASIPDSKEQVLRIVRGNSTLSFGGPAVKISDQWDSLLGKLKKKNFALGLKFTFVPEKQGETFILEIKGHEIFCDDKKVAAFLRWDSGFFKESKIDYAFSISEEVPANSQIRQVLLAFALAKHRIILRTSIPIPI